MATFRKIQAWGGRLQIGARTTDKLGFYGKTPAVRPSAYTVSNNTTTRTISGTASAASPVARALGTLIADLQSLGILQ